MAEVTSYVRSIRGPALLIVLGSLMLADQLGHYSFWRTWPVLLVALGFMVLLERLVNGARQGDRP